MYITDICTDYFRSLTVHWMDGEFILYNAAPYVPIVSSDYDLQILYSFLAQFYIIIYVHIWIYHLI